MQTTEELLENTTYLSYSDVLNSFGFDEIVVQHDDADYQGDSRVIFRDGTKYGYLIFGWGSCSGCDALEAAEGDVKRLSDLRQDLYNSIHWEPSLASLWMWLKDDERQGRYEFLGREHDEFMDLVREEGGKRLLAEIYKHGENCENFATGQRPLRHMSGWEFANANSQGDLLADIAQWADANPQFMVLSINLDYSEEGTASGAPHVAFVFYETLDNIADV